MVDDADVMQYQMFGCRAVTPEESFELACKFSPIPEILESVEKNPELLRTVSAFGQTPLHWAVQRGDMTLFRRVRDLAPDLVHVTDSDGETVLHVAAWKGHDAIAKHVLETHPSLALVLDHSGETPLHYAARWPFCREIVRDLLRVAPQTGALQCMHGYTPLHHAGTRAIAEEIITACPESVDVCGSGGETALQSAVECSRRDVVERILESNPNAAARATRAGFTPLDVALFSAKLHMADVLVRHGDLRDVARVLDQWKARRRLVCALFVSAVEARVHSMSSRDWKLVPKPCHGIEIVLPQALRRSFAHARQVLDRVDAKTTAKFTAALSCFRSLPSDVASTIAALAVSP